MIFGGSEDKEIPLGELKQAFQFEEKIYNRSVEALSVKDTLTAYENCVAPLAPETVLVHIGAADLEFFAQDREAFANQYRELIMRIKQQNPKCRIAVVSLRNYENDPQIAQINQCLKNIAASENCEYGDLAGKKLWNPKNTMDTASFLYSIGFVRPLRTKKPLYDLVKMLFCDLAG